MSHFTAAFADELVKLSSLGRVARSAAKHSGRVGVDATRGIGRTLVDFAVQHPLLTAGGIVASNKDARNAVIEKTRTVGGDLADKLERAAHTKLGGLLGLATKPLKLIAKHPMGALGVASVAVPVVMAAKAAYSEGLQGGEQGRYLSAGPDETGRIRASDAAYTNYHRLLKHDADPKAVAAMSRNFKKGTFRTAG